MEGLAKESLYLPKIMGNITVVCKTAPEQSTTPLEGCAVDRWDKTGAVSCLCPPACLTKIKTQTAFQQKHLPANHKRSWSLIIWRCFAATGSGHIRITEELWQGFQKANVTLYAQQLQLGWNWVMRHNDPKLSRKSAAEWLKSKRIKDFGMA